MEKNNLKSLVLIQQVKIALQIHTGKENPIIEDIQVQRSSSGVEGLATTLLRTKVFYRCEVGGATHVKSYLIKRLPETEWQLGIVQGTGLFEKESCFYGTVVPFCRRLAEGKVTLPMPESDYSIANGTEDAVYLDDLSILGYRIVDKQMRKSGVDLPHCEVTMEMLGRLHGLTSASERLLPDGAWQILGPPLLREVCLYEPAEGQEPSVILGAFETAMETAVELAKEMDGLPKEAAESGVLKKVLQRAWKVMCQFADHKRRDGPKVLCHGDFWVNNVMYRYDKNGKPVDAKVIDFQTTRYAHPCTDILHFFHCCTTRPLRDEQMDHLLGVYHASLNKTMELVGMGPAFISLEQLKEDAHGRCKVFGAVIGALWHPVFMLDEVYGAEGGEKMDTESMDDMLKNGNSAAVKKKFTEDECFRKEMTDIVKELVEVALPNGMQDLSCSPFRE